MRSNEQIGKQLDWVLILMYFLLVGLGWLNIYSAGYNEDYPSIFSFNQEYGKQFIWIIICTVLALIILLVDKKFFTNLAGALYLGANSLLVLVLIFGKTVNGAKSWFGIGSFGIQPSEFAKFATCLMLASILQNISQRNVRGTFWSVLFQSIGSLFNGRFIQVFTSDSFKVKILPFLIISIPSLLILLQPDAGTVLVFTSLIFVLYREGLSGNLLLVGFFGIFLAFLALFLKDTSMDLGFLSLELSGQNLLISILAILFLVALLTIKKYASKKNRIGMILFLWLGLIGGVVIIKGVDLAFEKGLDSHQKDRIMVLMGKIEDKKGLGYNVNQSMAAIGSGSLMGKGFLQGTLSNARNKHVPMQTTDFIFCSIGEEWGFIGSSIQIGLFLFLILRIIYIGERQRSIFTRIYAYGVANIIFFHFMINIGMTIGLFPVIGIPLPFFSYGGSSILGFTLLLFILIKLDSARLEFFR